MELIKRRRQQGCCLLLSFVEKGSIISHKLRHKYLNDTMIKS